MNENVIYFLKRTVRADNIVEMAPELSQYFKLKVAGHQLLARVSAGVEEQ